MPFANPTSDPATPVFYNVERAVGSTGANLPEDVRLVQYMIRHLYGDKARELAIDGFFGYYTARWISKFQADVKAAGQSIHQDGRVDRALGSQASITKTTYTIIWLNVFLRKSRPVAYANIPSAIRLTPLNQVGSPYGTGAPSVHQPGLIPETGGV